MLCNIKAADVTDISMMEPPKLLHLDEHIHFPKQFTWKDMTCLVKQWEPEKLTYLLETKLFKKMFFLLVLCLLFSHAWFKLFYFNTLEFFIFAPNSVTTLSAELVQAWKTETQSTLFEKWKFLPGLWVLQHPFFFLGFFFPFLWRT